MTREEVFEILGRLNGMFDGKVAKSDEAIEGWVSLLTPYAYADANKAATEVIASCRFTPKPIDIIEALDKNKKTNVFTASKSDKKRSLNKHAKDFQQVLTDSGWEDVDRAVYFNGIWKSKINFCLDVLGGLNVAEMIREVIDVNESNLTKQYFPQKNYLKLLELMTSTALEDCGISPRLHEAFIAEHKTWQQSHILGETSLLTKEDSWYEVLKFCLSTDTSKFYEVATQNVINAVKACGGFERLRRAKNFDTAKKFFMEKSSC